MTAQRHMLEDGRLHLQHGPIDLVIGCEGDAAAVADAHESAWQLFPLLLPELVAELPLLRQRVGGDATLADNPLCGTVARNMWQACWPHRAGFITPMAAVAGAVAQAAAACYRHEGITRAWVNNGGDISLVLVPGASVRIGLVADISAVDLGANVALDGRFEITNAMPVRGIATSGWRGRSFSLGIADSVTVLAATAAVADACATRIANAVDVRDARIQRRPACDLKDDTDLGALPVTVDVPRLGPELIDVALAAGLRVAETLRADGLIWGALMTCQRQSVATGFDAALQRTGPFLASPFFTQTDIFP
jgi:ApbE superfamily uncharacterized protein (UPF0280 family)